MVKKKESEELKECESCGVGNPDDASFCLGCGNKFDQEEETPKKKVAMEESIEVRNVPIKFKPLPVDKDTGIIYEEAIRDKEVLNGIREILKILRG